MKSAFASLLRLPVGELTKLSSSYTSLRDHLVESRVFVPWLQQPPELRISAMPNLTPNTSTHSNSFIPKQPLHYFGCSSYITLHTFLLNRGHLRLPTKRSKPYAQPDPYPSPYSLRSSEPRYVSTATYALANSLTSRSRRASPSRMTWITYSRHLSRSRRAWNS